MLSLGLGSYFSYIYVYLFFYCVLSGDLGLILICNCLLLDCCYRLYCDILCSEVVSGAGGFKITMNPL